MFTSPVPLGNTGSLIEPRPSTCSPGPALYCHVTQFTATPKLTNCFIFWPYPCSFQLSSKNVAFTLLRQTHRRYFAKLGLIDHSDFFCARIHHLDVASSLSSPAIGDQKGQETPREGSLLRLILSTSHRSSSPSRGDRLSNVNALLRNMNPTLGKGLNRSASKRARSTDSQRSLNHTPNPKISKTEDEEEEGEEDDEEQQSQDDISVPAFLRQSKAGKLHTRGEPA